MDPNLFVLILCLIVFVLLVAAFTFLIVKLYQSSILLIKAGVKDEDIKKEYLEQQEKKSSASTKVLNIFNIIILVLLWTALIVMVSTTLYITFANNNAIGEIPQLKTVESGSMSKKLESNYYLEENNLNDQFTTQDLVVLHKVPEAKDIELYDIVLYELNDNLILHRVVSIEYDVNDPTLPVSFTTQGDNVETCDMYPVSYDQLRGIYEGEKVAYLGSFIRFLKSPAGYICVIFVAVVTVVLPIIDRKINKIKKARLVELGIIEEKTNDTRHNETQNTTSVNEEI